MHEASFPLENENRQEKRFSGAGVSPAFPENADVPATGDTAQPGLWLCLGIMSLAGLIGVALLRRKQRV